jgi:hypothetical protein
MAKEELPFGGIAHKFEGYRYGDVGVSFFLVDSPPGGGAVLHTHPYEEIFPTAAPPPPGCTKTGTANAETISGTRAPTLSAPEEATTP